MSSVTLLEMHSFNMHFNKKPQNAFSITLCDFLL